MKKVTLVSIVMLGVLFMSCGSYTPSTVGWNSGELMGVPDERSEFAKTRKRLEDGIIERKILYSAYLTLAVKNRDTASVQISRIAKKYGGYVKQAGTYRAIIRVKSNQIENAVNDISALGKVRDKSRSGQDVTDQFRDFKIRLDNAEKARKRYLELLAKAENVEAALKVEKELERLNETIEMLKGRMKRLDHLSEFSTITVNLKEKKKLGLFGYVGVGLYHSVKWLFVRN